jgi:hypothetical protein
LANAWNGQHEAKAGVQFAIPCDEPESFALQPFHAMLQIALMTAHFLDYHGRRFPLQFPVVPLLLTKQQL